jgi:hypothetical protein
LFHIVSFRVPALLYGNPQGPKPYFGERTYSAMSAFARDNINVKPADVEEEL